MNYLYCFFLMTLATLISAGSAFSANELFRSVSSGNWNSTSTWEMSTNGGGVWFAATSVPHDTSGATNVRSPNTVTVTVSTSSNQLTIDGGGTLTINSGIVLTIPEGAGNDVSVASGGVVNGAGTVRTQGVNMGINIRAGSSFRAQLHVNTGNIDVYDQSSPFDGQLFGNLIIDSGATVQGGPASGRSLTMYGNVTNNGSLVATSTGGALGMRGPSLVNNGTINAGGGFYFDSVTTVSGGGAFTSAIQDINANGNVTLMSNVTFSPSSGMSVQTGGDLNLNNFVLTFNSGQFAAYSGSTVNAPGTFRTQGNVSVYPVNGSNFNADFNVNTGSSSGGNGGFGDVFYGNVLIDAGATMNCGWSSGRVTNLYGNVTVNGILTTSSTGGDIQMRGPALVNNGAINPIGHFSFDTTTTVTGSGLFTAANQWINPNGKVTLLSNVTFSPSAKLTLQPNGAVLNLNGFTMTFNSGELILNPSDTVNGPGTVVTQNNVGIYTGNVSAFKADIKVNNGTLSSGTNQPCRFFGNVTIENGATYNCGWSSGRGTAFYGNVINNGTWTASSTGGYIVMRGPSLVNNGTINSAGNFYFDSTTAVAGPGAFTSNQQWITPIGKVTLLSNVTFTPSSHLTMQAGAAVLNLNGFTLTFNSGEIVLNAGDTVNGPGLFRTQNNVGIHTYNNPAFKADIKVNTGSLTSITPWPHETRLFGTVTIDSGTTHNCGIALNRVTAFYGNVINNGTITASSTGGYIGIRCPSFVNNGIVGLASHNFYFDSTTTLSGTGQFTTTANVNGTANVTATSGHQLWDIVVFNGGKFNITNRLIKVKASNPIRINNGGTFTTTGSTVEYNGTAVQEVSVINITYGGLKINNPNNTYLQGSVTVNDTISVVSGDLDIHSVILTLASSGYLNETPGNTITGSSGYITTTRNINAPSSLNVGGLGAVLTTTSNLGNTVIRRGHAAQMFNFTSIKRYFDIEPSNNSGLNATFRFKYDESELGANNENLLTLYRSTNFGTNWTSRGGAPDASNNQITLTNINAFSRWTANSDNYNALIGVAMQGFYNASTNRLNMKDTIRVYLRNASTPYAIVDSAINTIDSVLLSAKLVFPSLTPGTYYLQLKHRNSIETWSKAGGETYIANTTFIYDFTESAANAYSSNQIQVDASPLKFSIYSGDVNQNGSVDAADLSMADNAAFNFVTGYVNTDVTGNNVVDASDLTIIDNNAFNFVSKMTPP